MPLYIILHANKIRRYWVDEPVGTPQPPPRKVCVGLHGGNGTPGRFDDLADFTYRVNKADYISVRPAAWNVDPGPGRVWDNGIPANDDGQDDVGFLRAMLAKVAIDYSVIPGEIYAMGMSSGGLMCQRMAYQPMSDFKGVCSVAHCLLDPPADQPSQPPSGAPSIQLIHGTLDGIVDYYGNGPT